MKHLLLLRLVVRPKPNYVLRSFLFHSGGKTTPSALDPYDTLQRRVARAGDPSASIVRVLDGWLDQGNLVKTSELHSIIKMLRKFSRFSHALQISDWMSEHRVHEISEGDVAIRLDLIAKVGGLVEADKFFETIPVERRSYHLYGALLNCYASNKALHKAQQVFQEMKDLGFLKGCLPYNVMLNLYVRTGKYAMVEKLLLEMEDSTVKPDIFTVNTRLHAYSVVSDVHGMEKFLMRCEADPGLHLDWRTYADVANGYLKAGLTDKALDMLRKSEQLMNPHKRKHAYEVLMSFYGAAGKKQEVYRLWSLYKELDGFYNTGYISVISALLKMDDIDEAERIIGEWEAGHSLFDIRIPHLLITGYCKKGMLEKAEEVAQMLVHKWRVEDTSTWERLALGYKMAGEMDKAVEKWKRAIEVSQPGWRPHQVVLMSCVDYLEGQRDMESLRNILRLLSERGHISYDQLLYDMNGAGLSWKIVDAMGENLIR
ncbi:PREDICTED: pentatricopeptide repeat-containing protein At2g20710, mitochondrial isoform X3 [Camelina sativa]|uniref:Pentatricopeptide repeat-containing protein At2g20710, mitochondrial isoform X1 n=1 Tax=Camelina sativa TaxID=90675 RepID=A0ABM0W9U9_CAMSA|nr:PREDICTED: pentatricopeptide repeat-containing protein At2g20710, mitochondrial isoform X1 [Camelina sativa]XP_010467775.1 PREDICTED: pentatricopeptide repeat-containing protein At2g20710, mitochondrial isoform X2 [Camelina sativa]XP_010467776.1 PREDICTED: pentatricopeptide repeat-containing protein At2g20710, mitochondrial isoform X3 [Camelina sativa]